MSLASQTIRKFVRESLVTTTSGQVNQSITAAPGVTDTTHM